MKKVRTPNTAYVVSFDEYEARAIVTREGEIVDVHVYIEYSPENGARILDSDLALKDNEINNIESYITDALSETEDNDRSDYYYDIAKTDRLS